MVEGRSLGGGQYHCLSRLQAGSDTLLEYLPEKEKLRDKTNIMENALPMICRLTEHTHCS
jgi:hypothetical protein